MQKLAQRIAEELQTANHYAVYQPDLARLWPEKDPRKREQEITQFAQRHGWRLRFYKDDLVAIFDKAPTQAITEHRRAEA